MSDTHNTKNFFAHGGNELVIGGKLTFLPGAEVEGGGLLEGAATSIPHQSDSTATTVAALKDDFNALLLKLREVGLMAAEAPSEQ